MSQFVFLQSRVAKSTRLGSRGLIRLWRTATRLFLKKEKIVVAHFIGSIWTR